MCIGDFTKGEIMRYFVLFAVIAVCAPFTIGSTIANAAKAKWTCSAKGMKKGSYSGGTSAYIHLESYKSGNRYPVTVVNPTKVTGSTSDGTNFTCNVKP